MQKVGKENIYMPVVGRHSLHQICNDNGFKTVNFALSRKLKISSTHFPHKEIHKGTWFHQMVKHVTR